MQFCKQSEGKFMWVPPTEVMNISLFYTCLYAFTLKNTPCSHSLKPDEVRRDVTRQQPVLRFCRQLKQRCAVTAKVGWWR